MEEIITSAEKGIATRLICLSTPKVKREKIKRSIHKQYDICKIKKVSNLTSSSFHPTYII